MADEIIQGDWDDLVSRQDLHGRKVRIIIIDEKAGPGEAVRNSDWVKRLRAWADSHQPLRHVVDDSRDGIYSGTVDDPH